MPKRSVLMRVHTNFKKLADNSELSNTDFTKVLTDDLWDEKIKGKRRRGLGGFRL